MGRQPKRSERTFICFCTFVYEDPKDGREYTVPRHTRVSEWARAFELAPQHFVPAEESLPSELAGVRFYEEPHPQARALVVATRNLQTTVGASVTPMGITAPVVRLICKGDRVPVDDPLVTAHLEAFEPI